MIFISLKAYHPVIFARLSLTLTTGNNWQLILCLFSPSFDRAGSCLSHRVAATGLRLLGCALVLRVTRADRRIDFGKLASLGLTD